MSSEKAWKLCVGLALAFRLFHLVALPIIVTFDGVWYVHLAKILGTSRFAGEWEYLRGPVFPGLLKIAFWLLGEQPLAVTFLQCCLGFGGVLLLLAPTRRVAGPKSAAILVAGLSLHPTLITYEHCLLTEVGSFFFLALIVNLLLRPEPGGWKTVVAIAGVLSVAFYFRSSFVYLSAPVGLAYAMRWFPRDGRRLWEHRKLLLRTAVIVVVPALAAYPWLRIPEVQTRTGFSVILYGLVKQAVLPIESNIWGSAQDVYSEAIRQSSLNGRFPLTGIGAGREYPPLDAISAQAPNATAILRECVFRYPARYLLGVGRTWLVYAGLSPFDSENTSYRRALLSEQTSRSIISRGPPHLPDLSETFLQRAASSAVAAALRHLERVFDALGTVSFVAIWWGLVAGFVKRQWPLFTLCFLAGAYLALHAAVLNSQDRMAIPATPLMITALVWQVSAVVHRICSPPVTGPR